MAQRLSSNLPPLQVRGREIVNADTQEPVLLRGINLSGLEYSSPDGQGSLAKARITEQAVEEIVYGWNANVIRVPFNQDWALAREGYNPQPYRNALEAVIAMAANCGAYTLLDLHWLDAHTPRGTVKGRSNFVAPLPNSDSITVWEQFAELWCEETAILYDIFNEPHPPLPDDLQPVFGIRDDRSTFPLRDARVAPDQWRPWMRHLISAIRSKHPDALVFVPGTDWGFDLRGCILPEITNLVYSTHVYASKGKHWQRAFGDLAGSVPVFAGEWGGEDDHLQWGQKLATYLDDHSIGWTAWSWSDEPRLITYPPEPPFEPTPFGSFVRELLRSGQTRP